MFIYIRETTILNNNFFSLRAKRYFPEELRPNPKVVRLVDVLLGFGLFWSKVR